MISKLRSTDTIDLIDYVLLRGDVQRIANSLEQMTEKSWWWDFWIPMLAAGLVAVIASLITYQLTKRIQRASDLKAAERYEQNQSIERENSNRIAINELLIMANSCYNTLEAIRGNYSHHLTSDLRDRIFQVPPMQARPLLPVDTSVISKLVFLTPLLDQSHSKWAQVANLDSLLQRYNMVMWRWEDRNKLVTQFYSDLDGIEDKPPVKAQVFELFPQNTFMKLFQSTEACVSDTKELMLDFLDLMSNFEEAYNPKLRNNLPDHLLDKVVHISAETLRERRADFNGEALADFEYIRPMCHGNDAFYNEKVRGLVSRYDYTSYGLK